MKTAVAAVIVASLSLVVAAISCLIAVKNYKKSKRLEFLQRRDRLSQAISNLNERNTEFHLMLARYDIVVVKNTALALDGEQAERNVALIDSMKEQRKGMEQGMKKWEEQIERLHFLYSNLTLETDAVAIESLISMVQVASDNLKKANDGYDSVLHILETTNEFIKTTLDERDEKIRQINLDFERGMREFDKRNAEQ
jgi:hypothetical protein